jgi:hypothetical protein
MAATDRQKKDYDVRSKTWRTVVAYHCAPRCAVGTLGSFKTSAIFRKEAPRAQLGSRGRAPLRLCPDEWPARPARSQA